MSDILTSVVDFICAVAGVMNGVGGGASTGARQRNLPTAPLLPGTLSIGGTGFGRVTYTSKGRLGGTSCVSTIWVAETQVTCGGARGVVEANTSAAVLLTVAWRWNTLLLGFSFDGPAVSMVLHSNSAKVGGTVTVSGINFGGSDYTPRAAIGLTAAQSTVWTSGRPFIVGLFEPCVCVCVCVCVCLCEERAV